MLRFDKDADIEDYACPGVQVKVLTLVLLLASDTLVSSREIAGNFDNSLHVHSYLYF